MRRAFAGFVLGLMVIAVGAQSSSAAFSIAYINSAGGTVDYLNNYGITVTYLNNPVGLTAASLSQYDAIMIASNSLFADPTSIGNAAAAFADSGKNVVLTQFDFYGSYAVSGQITQTGYSPFKVAQSSYTSGSINTVYTPASSLLTGVNTANVSTTFGSPVTLDATATLVADYNSGQHAIAYNVRSSGGAVVGLNLFPDVGYDGMKVDNQRLIANALQFKPSTVSVPEPASVVMMTLGLIGVAGMGFGRRGCPASSA